jgi:simple sugar transport system ATP-binding protein
VSESALARLRGISKSYPGVRALDGVDFDVRAGEVHALAGQNGAGKSTLVRLLGGVERADGGSMRVEGREFAPHSPLEALRAGVAVLHQETHLVPQLTVAENFFLGRELRRAWRLHWRAMREHTRERLRAIGLDLDVDKLALELPAALAQMVGIARAIDLGGSVLVLDEPTSSLDAAEVERLFALLRELKSRGLGLVFVAHSLEQIYAVADRITVLRDGRRVGTFAARELPRAALIEHMLGRRPSEVASSARDASTAPAFLKAHALARRGAIAAFDLSLARGEVVGLAGLLGSGRSELARVVFGAERATSGSLAVDGVERHLRSPRGAIALGFAFCPEDRKLDGAFAGLSIRDNIAIVAQRKLSNFGLRSRARHERLARRYVDDLSIAAASLDQALGTLSGGNQQKVLLARALASEPRLLILDEPTRGIDVGAKVEVERLVNELVARGMAVLFISSALEEVLRLAHKVLVLREGRVVAELEGAAMNEQRVVELIAHAAGESRNAG